MLVEGSSDSLRRPVLDRNLEMGHDEENGNVGVNLKVNSGGKAHRWRYTQKWGALIG